MHSVWKCMVPALIVNEMWEKILSLYIIYLRIHTFIITIDIMACVYFKHINKLQIVKYEYNEVHI